MNDLIRRQDAIDAVHKEFDEVCVWDESGQTTANEVENILYEVPSVEPERKKGKWVWEKKIPFERCRCSECGYCRQLKFPEPDYFCPNCGADMRGE